MEQQVILTGPMHPDLFDGETPMRISQPVPEGLHRYCVTVAWCEPARGDYEVIAPDENTAANKAIELAEQDTCGHPDNFESEHVEQMEHQEFTETELNEAGYHPATH